MAKLAAINYGDALLQLGKEADKQQSLLNEVIALQRVIKDNPTFSDLLNNPQLSIEEKLGIIKDVFEGKTDADLYSFLCLLVQKNRYNEIDSILDYYVTQAKEELLIGTAYVTCAYELSNETKAKIREKLLSTTDYKTIDIIYTVDEELIGGMIIRIKDRIIDNTVKNKIEQMKRSLHKMTV